MRKPFFRGFYSRALLFYIIIVCTVSISLAFLVSAIAEQNERTEYLKKYDIAISNLHQKYFSLQKNFYNVLAPLFSSPARYGELRAFMDTPNRSPGSELLRSGIIEMFIEIYNRDFTIAGILLHSNTTGDLYQFDPRYNSISSIQTGIGFPDYDPFRMGKITSEHLSMLGAGISGITSHLFGLVGTVPEFSDSGAISLGQIIVLYPVTAFVDTLSGYDLDEGAAITILTENGDMVFSSSGNYGSREGLILQALESPPEASVTTYPAETIRTGTGSFYVASIYNSRNGYIVTYQTPVIMGRTRGMIVMFTIFICAFSIGVYGATLRMTNRNVRLLRTGMEKIRRHDLSYRIPEPKRQDEFADIIQGFNMMIEQLGQNVQQLYIQEIQKKEAELYAMQASINPHFLYNTLEIIRVQTLHGDREDAARMILLLSKIYRSQMHRKMYVALEDELEYCENLIILYQYRFANFEYEFDIPEELLRCSLPENIMQPLVENYFVHGLNPVSKNNRLTLRGELQETEQTPLLCLIIEDNGKSIGRAELNALRERIACTVFIPEGKGFALYNINSRLRIAFGDGYGLTVSYGEWGKGFRVEMKLPYSLPVK